MEQAIKLAQEGGWVDEWEMSGLPKYAHYACCFRDPFFWQSLGKQQGWNELDKYRPEGNTIWKKHWHSFIDHIAQGRDIDEFFNQLIK